MQIVSAICLVITQEFTVVNVDVVGLTKEYNGSRTKEEVQGCYQAL